MDLVKDIQAAVLDVFHEFQRVCEKHGLRYFAFAGTCIGAVRHHGFIPWDDDLDVAMPMEDYIRFRQLAPRELREPYALYGLENKHWTQSFIKVHNTQTTFLEEGAADYPDRYAGVYIDIFPLCGMSSNRLMQKMEAYFCDLAQTLNIRQRRSFAAENSLVKKLFWIINIPIKLLAPYHFYTDRIEAHFKKHPFDNSDKIFCLGRAAIKWLHNNTSYNSVFYYEDFKDSFPVPFENGIINVAGGV